MIKITDELEVPLDSNFETNTTTVSLTLLWLVLLSQSQFIFHQLPVEDQPEAKRDSRSELHLCYLQMTPCCYLHLFLQHVQEQWNCSQSSPFTRLSMFHLRLQQGDRKPALHTCRCRCPSVGHSISSGSRPPWWPSCAGTLEPSLLQVPCHHAWRELSVESRRRLVTIPLPWHAKSGWSGWGHTAGPHPHQPL